MTPKSHVCLEHSLYSFKFQFFTFQVPTPTRPFPRRSRGARTRPAQSHRKRRRAVLLLPKGNSVLIPTVTPDCCLRTPECFLRTPESCLGTPDCCWGTPECFLGTSDCCLAIRSLQFHHSFPRRKCQYDFVVDSELHLRSSWLEPHGDWVSGLSARFCGRLFSKNWMWMMNSKTTSKTGRNSPTTRPTGSTRTFWPSVPGSPAASLPGTEVSL